MVKKTTGADWAKGGIITLSKPVVEENTTNTVNKANIVNMSNESDTANTVDKANTANIKKHRFTIDLDEEDFRKLRIMAAHYGKSITAYIREVIINGEGK